MAMMDDSDSDHDSELEMGTLHPDICADADIRLLFPGKAASAPASASPGGYPPTLAGIRADILGYPPSTLSSISKT
ncbi:Protein memo1 [Puccinia graminis f. sp. tritici]|uniref:Protein memo1 n=1 Tax=Puccinia graminis f. sp. tritici TaxID=56615 RepID=A0A5B0NN24_PUCGR|nr:Protein memo1 [Puccinia graminis f. sp. tritici]